MTRAELIEMIAAKHPQLSIKEIEQAVKHLFEKMAQALINQQRIEIRGFGSFSLRFHPSRTARNPKTGEFLHTNGKFSPHFKVGKELRERVNQEKNRHPIQEE